MASLLDAFVKIFADSKDVSKVLKTTIPRQAEDAGKEASSRFSKAFSSAKSQIIQGIGQGLGIGITQLASSLAGAAFGFIDDAIGAASDLNEEITKSDQIFGDNADAIQEWAAGAASSFGQSSRAALQAASNFAGMFKSVDVEIGVATEHAQKLTQLGSDLASFFNTGVESALTALRSGLSGEAEALKRYNVFLTEARVKDFAWRNGIAETGKELTEQQKILARYGLILEDTSDAQGDFAKTQDGLANTQRELAAEMENLAAEIGQDLLPIALDLASWLRDDGLPLFRDFVALVKEAAEGLGLLGDIASLINGGDIRQELELPLDALDALGVNTGEIRRKFQDMGVAVEQMTRVTGRELGKAEQATRNFAEEADEHFRDVEDASEDIEISIRDTAATWRRGAQSMIDWSQKLADETQTQRDEVVAAVTSLIDDAYDPLLLAYEIAAVKAELSADRQTRATEDLTTEEKRELDQRILNNEATYARLLAEQSQYGSDSARAAYLQSVLVSKAMTDGLNSDDENRRNSARAAAGVIVTELVKLVGPAGLAGFKTGDAYIDSLIDALIKGTAPLKRTLGGFKQLLHASSPPTSPENPLHDIDKWAARTGEAYVNPMVAAIGAGEQQLRDALREFAGAFSPPGAPEMDARSPWALAGSRASQGPSTDGSGDRAVGAPTGGITVNVQGLMRARDPLELVWQMSRAQQAGVLVEEPVYE